MGRFSNWIRLILINVCILINFDLVAATFIVTAQKGNPITNAIEKAQNGDTIIIKAGLYQEGDVILKKAITLIGEGFPVIDGEDKYENLLIEHDNVTIKGILFKNSGSSSFMDIAALKIKNSQNVLIENCKFENNFFGIHTLNSKYISYLNNELRSGGTKGKPSANGIHCWKSSHLTINNNIITGHRDGIYLEFVTESLMENNQSLNNSRYGLHFMFSHDDVYRNNIIKGNGAGVAVMYSKRVEMYNNLFAENWGNASYGVLLKEINDSKIIGNTFQENTISIFAEGANRVELRDNQFLKNGWALLIQASCSDVQV